jgi:hypothetical protein
MGLKCLGIALCSLLTLTVADDAAAQDVIRESGRFGIGLGGGTYTSGLSMKYFPSSATALQLTVGAYGYANRNVSTGLAVIPDFLIEMPTFFETDGLALAWSLGVGVPVGISGSSNQILLAATPVAGFEFLIAPAPFDIVLEYRPVVQILPAVGFGLVNFSAHVRFFIP